jgi:hypothetical protein
VEKAYKKKKQEAEAARDKAKLALIEDAHNQIFMASLTARLSVRCDVLADYWYRVPATRCKPEIGANLVPGMLGSDGPLSMCMHGVNEYDWWYHFCYLKYISEHKPIALLEPTYGPRSINQQIW